MRKNQLFINVDGHWDEIDLFEDTTIPITLKCTEVKNFASRNTGYSVEFNIPHTNNNAKTLGLVSDINIYRGSFEVGKDYPAYITNGGITTFDGQFRLKRVIKQNSGSYIYYVGNMFGGTKNFVDALGNKTLIGNDNPNDDLDFSEYNTPAEEMTLGDFVSYLQSHYTDGTGWGLTLLDKTNKAAQPFSGGSQMWYADECTPYLYAREIFEKLFKDSGYTYVSEFLQGTDFSSYLQDPRWVNGIGKYDVNSLIYPYMRHNSNLIVDNVIYSIVTQTDSINSKFYAIQDYMNNWDLTSISALYMSESKNTINLNSISQYYYILTENGLTSSKDAYKFIVPQSGFYHIKIKIPFKVKCKYGEFLQDGQGGWYLSKLITPSDYAPNDGIRVVADSYFPGLEALKWSFSLKKNNEVLAERKKVYNTISERIFLSEDINSTYSYTWDEDIIEYDGDVILNAGDVLSLDSFVHYRIRKSVGEINPYLTSTTAYYTGSGSSVVTHEIYPYPMYIEAQVLDDPNTNEIINISLIPSFGEESPFSPNSILNPKTTKIDFFNNFIKMFNLYVEDVSGKKNYKAGGVYPPNTLRIEPYEIFYAPELGNGQSNIKDWTNKIDWETVEYRRCEDYLYNIQNFTKVQDSDFYNSNYNSTYKLPYGNREVVGEYCTKDDRNSIELKVSSNLCGVVNNSTDTLQCPKVFSLDNTGNIDTKKEYSDGIFFIWRNYMNNNTDLGTNYTLKLQSRFSSSYQNVLNYYCADTLNKGYGTDDANLNWGETSTYYQNMKGTIPTYNDLFNAFYAKEYAEKTSQDAIILRAKAYLTQLDINTVQLSDTIVINDDYYHILEINQWEDSDKPCEIELIKTRPNFPLDIPNSKNITTLPQNQLPITVDTASLVQQINTLQTEIALLK